MTTFRKFRIELLHPFEQEEPGTIKVVRQWTEDYHSDWTLTPEELKELHQVLGDHLLSQTDKES